MAKQKQMTWPYIAGFFDGEGHLGLRARCSYRVVIGQIEGRDDVLWEIQDFLEEYNIENKILRNASRAGTKRNPRIMIYLSVSRRQNVIPFLTSILPYLRVKTEEVEVALQNYSHYESDAYFKRWVV